MAGYPAGGTDRRAALEARRARRAAVTDPAIVMEAAAQLLSVRARSIAEMRRRLAALGYEAGLIEEVIGRLEGMAYLDDHAFATAWVASRDRSRPRGGSALRQELRLKGIDDATIRAVLAERDVAGGGPTDVVIEDDRPAPERADLAAARQLLERKVAALGRETDIRKRRQKAYALLARNGFDPDACRQAIAMASWLDGSTDAAQADAPEDP